jgi:hypothetical protein
MRAGTVEWTSGRPNADDAGSTPTGGGAMSVAGATAEERARKRVEEFVGLMWHIGVYVVVNAFLWFIDLRSDGAGWAYWVTLGWGVGLLFHVVAYFVDRSGFQERRYQRYLAQERAREGDAPIGE